METILINPQEIESCWESKDVCFVKTKTGRVWLCCKEYPLWGISTKAYILNNSLKQFLELPLAKKGKSE